jgi:hypothetical protein
MEIRAVLFALPRLEVNRLEEWVDIMMAKGITSLALRSHFPSYKVWWKKPDSKFYNLELSDSELYRKWDSVLARISKLLPVSLSKVETSGPGEDVKRARAQIQFVNDELVRSVADGVDWVVHCDVDEIPNRNLVDVVVEHPGTAVFMSNQVVFGSSLVRKIRDIKRYHPKKIMVSKCLVDPRKCSFKNMHLAVPSGDGVVVKDAFLFHHFRGIAKAHFKPLESLVSFPSVAIDPTLPVHLDNCELL